MYQQPNAILVPAHQQPPIPPAQHQYNPGNVQRAPQNDHGYAAL